MRFINNYYDYIVAVRDKNSEYPEIRSGATKKTMQLQSLKHWKCILKQKRH